MASATFGDSNFMPVVSGLCAAAYVIAINRIRGLSEAIEIWRSLLGRERTLGEFRQ